MFLGSIECVQLEVKGGGAVWGFWGAFDGLNM